MLQNVHDVWRTQIAAPVRIYSAPNDEMVSRRSEKVVESVTNVLGYLGADRRITGRFEPIGLPGGIVDRDQGRAAWLTTRNTAYRHWHPIDNGSNFASDDASPYIGRRE